MLKRLTTVLILLLVPFMLVACTNDENIDDEQNEVIEGENNPQDEEFDENVVQAGSVKLDNIKNGAIFVHSSKNDNRENFIKEFKKYADELKVSAIVLDIDDEKDMLQINNYLSKYEEIIDDVDRYYELEEKIYTPHTEELIVLSEGLNEFYEEYGQDGLYLASDDIPFEDFEKFFELNDEKIQVEYEISEVLRGAIDEMIFKIQGLIQVDAETLDINYGDIVFEEELAEEIDIITANANITTDEIIEYIKVNDLLVYSNKYYQMILDNRYKDAPVVFVISDGILQNVITTKSSLIPSEEELENPSIAENVMKDIVGFHMNQPSDEAKDMIAKIKAKETFIAFIGNNYCYECENIEELLNEELLEDKLTIVDYTIAENQRVIQDYLFTNEIELDVYNTPILISIVNGEFKETLQRDDLLEEEMNEDILEFTVKEDNIKKFINK